ncbi:MAG TPA: HEAT repeat domain-containing protein, partial [Planctomycetaceae bacterium]
MPEIRSPRGIPLPGFSQICVLAAAVVGTAILWSEFHRIRQLPAVSSGQPDLGEKLRSVLELSRHGESALDELTPLLDSEDRTTRHNALLALISMGPEAAGALGTIRARFADKDPMVRGAALAAFSRICDDQDQVLATAAGFLADTDLLVRELAARTLQMAGPSAISPLIAMAHSESPDARQLVIRLLPGADKFGDPDEVKAALRSLMDDPVEAVRLQAIKAVVDRHAAQLDEIRGWLRDEDPKLIAEGVRAVNSLGVEAAPVVLPDLADMLEKTNGPTAWAVLNAISHFKAGAAPLIPALLRYRGNPNSGAHFQIAQTLLAIGAESADLVPILISFLASEKTHNDYCWQAGHLLARIDPEEARRQVSRLIVKIAARENDPMEPGDSDLSALCGLGAQAQEAVPLLIRLLSHPSRTVPGTAMATICGLGPA